MERVNFKDFRMYADIMHTSEIVFDVREQFADLIYKNSVGVVGHNLAFKILNSEGAIEITDAERPIINKGLELCTPQFRDSFTNNII